MRKKKIIFKIWNTRYLTWKIVFSIKIGKLDIRNAIIESEYNTIVLHNSVGGDLLCLRSIVNPTFRSAFGVQVSLFFPRNSFSIFFAAQFRKSASRTVESGKYIAIGVLLLFLKFLFWNVMNPRRYLCKHFPFSPIIFMVLLVEFVICQIRFEVRRTKKRFLTA